MRVLSRLAGLTAVLGATLGLTSTAEAACYGSTPAGVTFIDNPLDADLAPEITTIQGALDGACTYSVAPGIDALIPGDAAFVYIDRDNNVATGSATFPGADVVVGTLGQYGFDTAPLLGTWNGFEFTFADPTPLGAPRGDGGFATSVDRLGIGSGVTTNFIVGSIYQGTYADYVDFAPDPGLGQMSLPVANSATPPAPAPVSSSPPPVQKNSTVPACVVPNVRGRRIGSAKNRLFNADCDFASSVRREYSRSVRKGRVIRTTPAAGARTTKTVRLVVSKGRRRAGSASLATLGRLEELANATADR